MATLKLIVIPGKEAKDGTHKIRIAVGHKSMTRYIVTQFKIDSLSQFKNGQVVRRPDAGMMNVKLRNLLNEYQDKLDSIKHVEMYDCKQLREMLVKNFRGDEQATFQCVANSYIETLLKEGRQSYAKLLERNCRYFTEFVGGTFMLEDITPELINNYAEFIRRTKNVCETTVNMMMSRTKTIINRGINLGLVNYEFHPFRNYKIKESPVREVDISLESFNKIRLSTLKNKKYVVARDLFCLSFYLGGINLIDLLSIDFRGKDTIEYVRTKCRNTTFVKQKVVLPIATQAKEIINKWMNKSTGKLDFGYKLTYQNFYRYLTRSLEQMSKILGINQKVVFYSARKSFAQYASEIGIPDRIIDYCLGHSDKGRGVIRYYTKVRQKQAEIAINKVIDYVNNPEKYKDYIELNMNIMLMKL